MIEVGAGRKAGRGWVGWGGVSREGGGTDGWGGEVRRGPSLQEGAGREVGGARGERPSEPAREELQYRSAQATTSA